MELTEVKLVKMESLKKLSKTSRRPMELQRELHLQPGAEECELPRAGPLLPELRQNRELHLHPDSGNTVLGEVRPEPNRGRTGCTR